MAYVNEEISKEDYEKYNLAEVDKRSRWSSPGTHWAIDRERDGLEYIILDVIEMIMVLK